MNRATIIQKIRFFYTNMGAMQPVREGASGVLPRDKDIPPSFFVLFYQITAIIARHYCSIYANLPFLFCAHALPCDINPLKMPICHRHKLLVLAVSKCFEHISSWVRLFQLSPAWHTAYIPFNGCLRSRQQNQNHSGLHSFLYRRLVETMAASGINMRKKRAAHFAGLHVK